LNAYLADGLLTWEQYGAATMMAVDKLEDFNKAAEKLAGKKLSASVEMGTAAAVQAIAAAQVGEEPKGKKHHAGAGEGAGAVERFNAALATAEKTRQKLLKEFQELNKAAKEGRLKILGAP
jgi:hypothetical protein